MHIRLIRSMPLSTGLVAYAVADSEYQAMESIQIQCTWYGLKDRRFADFDPGISWHDRTCHAGGRSTGGRFSFEQLTGNTTSVVVTLAAPVLVLFGGWETTAEWVDSLRPGFRSL